MTIPDHVTLLSMHATDIPGKTYNVILETANHFEIIVGLREQYQTITGNEAEYNYDKQIITMNLTEEHIFQVIDIIQDYAGRIETPETYPTQEELDEQYYHLLTTPPPPSPPEGSEAPF